MPKQTNILAKASKLQKEKPPKNPPKTKRGLGRLFAPDKRDMRFPMSLVRLPKRLPAYRYWTPGEVLNQNGYPQCVAYAWKGFLLASPLRQGSLVVPKDVYDLAQKIDEWPGEGYAGTSVRAGVKVLEAMKYIASYLWAENAEQLKNWVLVKGPVVVGTSWYQGMFTVDVAGFVSLTGSVAGGHAYLVLGYSASRKAFRCLNSWGAGWGQSGRFWIREADFERLLVVDGGEAVTAVEKKVAAL